MIRHNRRLTAGNSGPDYYLNWPIAELSDLSSLELAPDTGMTVWVQTLDAVFTADPESTLTPDGITVIGANGGGNWVRQLVPSIKWQERAEWWIDFANGNDENDGGTALAPIRTWAEFRRRVGEGNFHQDVLVWLVNGDESVFIDGNFTIQGDNTLTVRGVVEVERTGTLTGATALNAAGNQPQLVEDSAADFAPDLGRAIRITSGAAAGALAWIAALSGGADTVRTSPFHTYAGGNGVVLSTIVGDEEYQIESALPQVGNVTATATRNGVDAVPFAANALVVQDVRIQGTFPQVTLASGAGSALVNCDVRTALLIGYGLSRINGCRLETTAWRGDGLIVNACFVTGLASSSVAVVGNGISIGQHTLCQGRGLAISALLRSDTDGFCVFDSTLALKATPGGMFKIGFNTLVWGSGNTTALELEAGSRLVYNGTKPIIAGTTEVNLGDGGDVNTWANQPRYYAPRDAGVFDEVADATIVT